jgi:vacuolar-type H+-ATPase subunit I/STV1
MSNSDLGYSDATELSDDTRREISEFVNRSDHYDSVEEFIEDAARYQIELLQRTTDTAQKPAERTNSAVLRMLTVADRIVTELHQRLLDSIDRYRSFISQPEEQPTQYRSRTTAAEKMQRYGGSDDVNGVDRAYRQRTAEMRGLMNREQLSSAEIEQEIRDAEDV